jgi:hypothetical protein
MRRGIHHVANPASIVYAGQKIDTLTFIVNTIGGEECLRIGLSRHLINSDGEMILRTTPTEARQIARELAHTADLLELKEKIKGERS